MFLKEAAVNVGKKIFNWDVFSKIQKQFLVQVVFLAALKNYINRCITYQPIFIIPPTLNSIKGRNRIILVLDMDETLVHTRKTTKPLHHNYIEHEDMFIQQRPNLREFLKIASTIFTLYIYTAGQMEYADKVIDCFDPQGLIQKRFYRQHCKKMRGDFIKDLNFIKRKSKSKQQMVLLDDNIDSINKNYPFSVQIQPFQGNQQDNQLKRVFDILLKFYQC